MQEYQKSISEENLTPEKKQTHYNQVGFISGKERKWGGGSRERKRETFEIVSKF